MTGTLNTLMVTVPAAIVVAAVYEHVPGGAAGGLCGRRRGDTRNLSLCARTLLAGFGITLAFGLLAATVADQTFWQKVRGIKGRRSRALFLGRRALLPDPDLPRNARPRRHRFRTLNSRHRRRPRRGRPLHRVEYRAASVLVILYVLAILAACYSRMDGASAALSSIVAVDVVKRYWPETREGALFLVTKFSMLLGGAAATAIVLSGIDFTTLVLTTYALKTSILQPLVLAILWPRTNTVASSAGWCSRS